MSLHVCRPTTVTLRAVLLCPTCERQRRFVGSVAVWYGTTWTCCACGDAWGDGERLPRPFARGWRDRATAEARRRWAQAPPRAMARQRIAEMLAQEAAA